jgi:hypothetical protein
MSYVPARRSNHGGVIEIQSAGWLTAREQRQAAREITRTQTRSAVITAREVAKVEAVAEVAESALVATSEVSALEAALMQRTPHAQARLQHVADAGCAAMAGVVMRTGRGR